MADDAPRVKRSRFDQTEPERKTSRFDRRSRSPVSRTSEARRSRSPGRDVKSPSTDDRKSASFDPAAAAAAAAAKINAELQARKGIQHVDVPPIRSTLSPTLKVASPSTGQSTSNVDGEIYIADGDYIKDIEVNDLRNRYTLTKGSTQKMIKEETGADVTTRGSYYPDKSMATAASPPLYLHVTSTSKSGLEKAIEKIDELMKQELPNLVDERRFRRREPEQFERDEFGRRKWPEERIQIDMENVPGFNLRAQVVGQGGAYVKHIQQETRCRVQIKGRGSGFMEHSTGQESDEPMYLHVAGPDPKEVERAKELCEDLLKNVRGQYEHFKANPPPQRMESYTDGYGADAHRGSYGGGGGGGYGRGRDRDRDRDNSYSSGHQNQSQNQQNQNQNNYAAGPYTTTPTNPAPGTGLGAGAGAAPADPNDASAQWAAYYAQQPGGDPYAAYGGYEAYAAYYNYYAQQQAQQGGGGAPPGGELGMGQGQAPPPPGGQSAVYASPGGMEANPPPPPPGSGGYASNYSNVPPPPGM